MPSSSLEVRELWVSKGYAFVYDDGEASTYFPTYRKAAPSEIVSASLNLPGVETVDWCEAHRSIAWEDFEERPFEEFVSRGYRCPSGAWIEGANAWDCHMIPVAIIPIPGDPS